MMLANPDLMRDKEVHDQEPFGLKEWLGRFPEFESANFTHSPRLGNLIGLDNDRFNAENFGRLIGNIAAVDRKRDFYRLAAQWKRETGHFSVIQARYENNAYKKIIEMKRDAIPFILEALRHNPDRWFDALSKLTGENPAKGSKSFYQAVDRWIAWGFSGGYIS